MAAAAAVDMSRRVIRAPAGISSSRQINFAVSCRYLGIAYSLTPVPQHRVLLISALVSLVSSAVITLRQ